MKTFRKVLVYLFFIIIKIPFMLFSIIFIAMHGLVNGVFFSGKYLVRELLLLKTQCLK
jgi:hypothetical protein